jgi:hypothetical protein
MVYLMEESGPIITYNVPMTANFWNAPGSVIRNLKNAQALGKSLVELFRNQLRRFAKSHFEGSIAEFSRLSGRGNSRGWRFDRDLIHNRGRELRY